MNGSIESLISSCRKAFHATSNYLKRSYTFSDWKTIVAEANYLVNSRPLFPKNVADLDEEPITENSLLLPYKQCSIPQSSNNKSIDPRLYAKLLKPLSTNFGNSGYVICLCICYFVQNGFDLVKT